MWPKVLTGARLIVYINGSMFGKINRLSWEDITPHKEASGVDMVMPIELMPTRKSIQGVMNVYRLAGDGGAEGSGMAGVADHLSTEKYFTILVLDRLTDKVVFRSDFNKTERQSWQIATKALVEGSISFKGLVWSNEVS